MLARLFILLGWALVPAALPQDVPPPEARAAESREFRAEILITPTELLPGIPVAVYVSLENTSPYPALAPYALSDKYRTLEVSITTPDGERSTPDLMFSWGCKKPFYDENRMEWPPGRKLRTKAWPQWEWGEKGYGFNQPGTYRVDARVRLSEKEWLEVPAQRVTVTESDLVALEAGRRFPLRGPKIHSIVWVPARLSEEDVKRLESLADDPNAPIYGAYARFYLARHHAAAILEEDNREPTEGQRTSALEVVRSYIQLLDYGLPPSLEDEARVDLSRLYARLGRMAEARELVEELLAGGLPYPLTSRLPRLPRQDEPTRESVERPRQTP